MYLIYLRYISYFFFANAILNIIFVIIFLTGNPLPQYNFRDHPNTMFAMQALTILNITATDWKILLCFLNSMVTIPAMLISLYVSYSKLYQEDENNENLALDLNSRKLSELDLKNCSIKVTRLDSDKPRIS